MKMMCYFLIFLSLNFNLAFSDEKEKINVILSVVKDDEVLNTIKTSLDKEELVFFTVKNNYCLLSFPKKGNSVYYSSDLGNFEGKFNQDFLVIIKKLYDQEGDIRLSEEDTKIAESIRDGLAIIVSQVGGHFHLSDPIILFFSEDEKYSKKLNTAILSILQILYESSKFDARIHKYLTDSVDHFDGGFENFDHFLVSLKKQREEYRIINR